MALFALLNKLYPKQAISLFSASEFHARVENITLSINQVRSPIQLDPQHLLLWVFVGFWLAQGEIYFRAEYLISNLWLYLCFFKKWGYME
jgi:hypothetical protein